MNKRDKVDHILALVKELLDKYLEFDEAHGGFVSAEEMVVASVEQVTAQQITRTNYSSPVATVDRSQVSFMVGDDMALPVYGDTDDTD